MVVYAFAGNGFDRLPETSPFLVMVNALDELSIAVRFWQVRRDVPLIAVSGAVGGVKFAV